MKIYRKEHFGGVLYDTDTLRFDLVRKIPEECTISTYIDKELPDRKDILSAPVRVYFELTRRCNLYCKHCFVSSYWGDEYGEDTDFILEIINELYDNGVLDLRFTGGEPTIRNDIFQILRYAKDKKFSVSLNTNGVFDDISNVANKLAELDLEQVTISIDGMRKNHE